MARCIGVGVASADVNSPVLAAAADEAEQGDTIRLVHAYLPPVLAERDWAALERAGDAPHAAAGELLASVAGSLSRRRRDVTVEAQACEGTPVAVLQQAACHVDLVVVGAARRHPWRSVGLALARTTACPVLVVGAAPQDHVPVTAVLHDPVPDAPVLDLAFAWAARRRSALVVLRAWLPAPEADLVEAETAEQKSLDGYLSSWQVRFPHVGVSVELHRGRALDVVAEQAAAAPLLVIGQLRSRHDSLITTALGQRRPLTFVVPVVTQRVPRPAQLRTRRLRSMTPQV